MLISVGNGKTVADFPLFHAYWLVIYGRYRYPLVTGTQNIKNDFSSFVSELQSEANFRWLFFRFQNHITLVSMKAFYAKIIPVQNGGERNQAGVRVRRQTANDEGRRAGEKEDEAGRRPGSPRDSQRGRQHRGGGQTEQKAR